MAGRFWTFEGIDGAGKSTVIQAVAERLAADGETVWVTREETDTWRGQAIRQSIRDRIAPATTAMLFVSDRVAHCQEIEAHLREGATVLCDRFIDSTYAYQSVAMGGDAEPFLDALHEAIPLMPDRTVLMDLEPEVAVARAEARGETAPYEHLGFLQQVRAAYLRRQAAEPERIRIVDASRPPDQVAEAALDALI